MRNLFDNEAINSRCTFYPGLGTSFKSYGLDPKKLGDMPAFEKFSKRSKRYYLSTWSAFVQHYRISMEKLPTEQDLCEFLKAKLEAGIERSTVRVAYSHLTFARLKLYQKKLPKFASLLSSME